MFRSWEDADLQLITVHRCASLIITLKEEKENNIHVDTHCAYRLCY